MEKIKYISEVSVVLWLEILNASFLQNCCRECLLPFFIQEACEFPEESS